MVRCAVRGPLRGRAASSGSEYTFGRGTRKLARPNSVRSSFRSTPHGIPDAHGGKMGRSGGDYIQLLLTSFVRLCRPGRSKNGATTQTRKPGPGRSEPAGGSKLWMEQRI